jgi:hypothetical protein
MITQAIKGWLHKVFAWWPWKHSTPAEYTHVASSPNRGPAPEAATRSTIDGIAPQAGAVPRLSTIEEWPERVVQPYFPPPSQPQPVEGAETPRPSSTIPPVEKAVESKPTQGAMPPAPQPTPQQRLEFLQYLVKRGIVNEGFEDPK